MDRALVARAIGISIAGAGTLIALAPSTWIAGLAFRLVGSGELSTNTHRTIAIAGAIASGFALARLGALPPRPLHAIDRTRLHLAAVVAPILVAQNASLAWQSFGQGGPGYFLGDGNLVVCGLLVVASLIIVVARTAWTRSVGLASLAGLGYGAFSALWHCCPPIGSIQIAGLAWLAALSLAMGAIGRAAAVVRAPVGELIGALGFAVVYPWHTPLWFAQCLIGGAFATRLVRVTGSGLAPTAFLAAAYVAHTTLPFI